MEDKQRLPSFCNFPATAQTDQSHTQLSHTGGYLAQSFYRIYEEIMPQTSQDPSQTAEAEQAEPQYFFPLSLKRPQPQVKVKLQLLLNYVFLSFLSTTTFYGLFPFQVDCLREISHSVLALGAQRDEPLRAEPLAACFAKLLRFAKKHFKAPSSSLSCDKRACAPAGMSHVQHKGSAAEFSVQNMALGVMSTRSGATFSLTLFPLLKH